MHRVIIVVIMFALFAQGSWAELNSEKPGEYNVSIALTFHEKGNIDTAISGVEVTIFDGTGKLIERETDNSGNITLEGAPGTWKFSAFKSGYKANVWEMPIASSDAKPKQAYLIPIPAMIDEQLLNLIDEFAPKYYNENWNLSLEQYKAWIATIAWSEGNRGGYSAHSQCRVPNKCKDMEYHWSVGRQFRFSTGIGPFQLDRGGNDKWDSWPTIDKLNYSKALVSVLNEHYTNPSFGSGTNLKNFSDKSKWYGVWPDRIKNYWNEVTGTSWDEYNVNRKELDWAGIKIRLAQNARVAGYLSYEKNVNYLGSISWNITTSDNITTDGNRQILFNVEYPTWHITARDAYGNTVVRYYYTYNPVDKIEVLAWNNSGSNEEFRYIFVREYSTGPYPENSSSDWLFGGFSLPHSVINVKPCESISLLSGDFHPVNITVLNSAGTRVSRSEVVIDTYSTKITDSIGNLSIFLADGNHTINASKPGYGTGTWNGYINHTLTSSINITLRPVPKYPFLISAVNSANFSLEGADIMVDGILRGRTGPNGDIRIEMTDGNHTITGNMSGYGSGNWTGELDHARMKGIAVRLNGASEYPFSVTVTNALGYLMEGANVSTDGISRGPTDRNGQVRVMLTEGTHIIEANKTDYGSGNWTGTLNYSLAREVAVRLNGALEHPFNVTVVNSANYNVEGAMVSTGGDIMGTTDRHGRLRVWLVEGLRTINATKAGYGSGSWTGILNHSSMSGVVVQLKGSLEYPLNVTVINPARYTVPGAEIKIDGKLAGITDAYGGFTAMLPEGNHTIEANQTGYSPGNWTGHFNHSLMAGMAIELGVSSITMNQKPIDLCLVLDTSGSMDDPECNDTSKIEAVKKAAQDTIAGFFFPGSANRIAVVSFSDVSSTISEFTNNYFEAYANVSQLYAGGSTSFGLGLSQAVNEFDRTNRTDQVPVILFMSDGMHNTPPDFGYYIAQCMFKGIRVYTVGYGSEADHELLKDMALFSGGEYLFADPCGDENSQIQNAFTRLQMSLSGWRNVMNASGAVAPNETINITKVIVPPDSQYIIFNVVYPGSHLIVHLVDPNGKVVDPKNYIYTEDKRIITLRLRDPVPGEYTVQVFGDQVDGKEPFTVYFSSEYIAPEIPDVSIGSIVIKETSGQRLLDHPVQIPFDTRSFPSDADEDGSDVNIFDQNGREIPRWVESWDVKTRKGSIWVKIPEIPADGEVRLRLLTGNPGAPAENNGSNIFPFFDDFEDGSINSNTWFSSNSSLARIEEANGTLHIYADEKSNSSADFSSIESFSPDVALRFRANASMGQGSDYKGMGFLGGNVGHDQEGMQDGVYWLGREKNLFVRHKYSAIGMSTLASGFNSFKSKYDAKYRIWQIKWFNSSIEYELDGNAPSSPPKNVGIPVEPINIGFSINTTHQAYPSEIFLDWVLAYIPAKTSPKVTIETE